MNSRERVLAVFAGKIPDRVPINYLGNPGIDSRLKRHFRLAPDDGDGLAEKLGVDFLALRAPYRGPRLFPEIEGRRVSPDWGIRTREIAHSSGSYWDYCDFPLRGAGLEAVDAWPMPDPEHYDYDALRRDIRDRGRDYALLAGSPSIGDIMNGVGMIRGVEDVYMDLADGDAAFLRYVDRRLNVQLEVLKRTLEAAEGRFDVVWMGEDLGTQRAPLISLDLYRRQLRPRHRQIVDLARSFNLPTMVHTCGSSSWVYEDFIAMGVKAVETLQPEADNMSPRHLKDRFGGRLAFHGCISTAGAVANGSPADVEGEVREVLDIMMPGGGYMLAPTHHLQDNSPTENVLALYETARTHGRY